MPQLAISHHIRRGVKRKETSLAKSANRREDTVVLGEMFDRPSQKTDEESRPRCSGVTFDSGMECDLESLSAIACHPTLRNLCKVIGGFVNCCEDESGPYFRNTRWGRACRVKNDERMLTVL